MRLRQTRSRYWNVHVLLLVLVIVTLQACSDFHDFRVPLDPSEAKLETSAIEYLPYGVPVPPGTKLTAHPPPYDPRLHGPPRENPIPEHNLSNYPDSVWPIPPRKIPPPNTTATTSPTLNTASFWTPYQTAAGWYLWTGNDGIFGMSNVRYDLEMNFDEIGSFLYSPVHMPFGGSCLEIVYAYYQPTSIDPMRREFWVWDHCAPDGVDNRVVIENMDNTGWKDNYVREFGDPLGQQTYAQINREPASCHTLMLFNFLFGEYDEKWSTCDWRDDEWGWTAWEYHASSQSVQHACYSKPSIQAQVVSLRKILMSESIMLAEAVNTGQATDLLVGPCFQPGQPFSIDLHQYGGWHAFTPN